MDDFLTLIEDAAIDYGVDNIATLPPEIIAEKQIDETAALSIFERYHDQIDNLECLVILDFATIRNTEDNRAAVDTSSQIKTLIKNLEDERKRVKEPYLKVTRLLDGKVKDLKDRLEILQGMLNEKIRQFLIDEQTRIMERMKPYKMNTLDSVQPEISVVAVTDSGASAKLEQKLTWRLADLSVLPFECFLERSEHIEKAIAPWVNARIKAGITDIKGILFETETVLKTK